MHEVQGHACSLAQRMKSPLVNNSSTSWFAFLGQEARSPIYHSSYSLVLGKACLEMPIIPLTFPQQFSSALWWSWNSLQCISPRKLGSSLPFQSPTRYVNQAKALWHFHQLFCPSNQWRSSKDHWYPRARVVSLWQVLLAFRGQSRLFWLLCLRLWLLWSCQLDQDFNSCRI